MLWALDSEPVYRTGSWSFAQGTGEITTITFAGVPVLRGIQTIARDADWGTLSWLAEEPALSGTGATSTLRVGLRSSDQSLAGSMVISVEPTHLCVTCDLVAQRDLMTNRTGLVVLHHPDLAGQPLTVVHPDGSTSALSFPSSIAPFQPAFDVAGYHWEHNGHEIELAFEGDVFEMEDQRNWTDASFKTYSRPLSAPFPYRVRAGEHIVNSVRVSVHSAQQEHRHRLASSALPRYEVELVEEGEMPLFALGASTAPDPQPALPGSVATAPLLVELDLASTNWRAALDRACRTARSLDVRLIASDTDSVTSPYLQEAISRLAQCEDAGIAIERIGLFSSTTHGATTALADCLITLRDSAHRSWRMIGGTRAHFTELNREHPSMALNVDEIGFSSTPLFHQESTGQIIDAIAMQRITARQAVTISRSLPGPARPIVVGPITLRPRFNNVATRTQPAPVRADLHDGYGAEFAGTNDRRQAADELAAWLVSSAAAFAVPGVRSITFFEQWGPRGLVDARGVPFPLADAFREVSALRGALLWSERTTEPVWALGSRTTDDERVLVANLSPHDALVDVHLAGSRRVGRARLNPFSFERVIVK